jgi:hypothetical protein
VTDLLAGSAQVITTIEIYFSLRFFRKIVMRRDVSLLNGWLWRNAAAAKIKSDRSKKSQHKGSKGQRFKGGLSRN